MYGEREVGRERVCVSVREREREKESEMKRERATVQTGGSQAGRGGAGLGRES